MRNGKKLFTAITTAMFATFNLHASPPCDDHTGGEGCVPAPNNSSGVFEFSADFDVETHTYSGNLTYADVAAGIAFTSSNVFDYTYIDLNVRGMIYLVNGQNDFNEARVFATDYGASGDELVVQLLQNGNLVYQSGGSLQSVCGGGVDVVSLCQETPGCALEVKAAYQVVARGEVRLNYTIKNTGPVPVQNLNVTDSFGVLDLSAVSLPMAPGASVTLTVNQAVTAATVVTVSANGNDENCKSIAQVTIPKTDCIRPTNPRIDRPPTGNVCPSQHLSFAAWKLRPSTKACTPEAKAFAQLNADILNYLSARLNLSN